MDANDLARFFQSMKEFNTVKPIGSLYLKSRNNFSSNSFSGPTAKAVARTAQPLVEFVAFCLNPNHYHFILRQLVDGGISEFMKRLAGGYTWHFNNKHERSGALFQGKFKSAHINSDNRLLCLSAYVNLNYRVHRFGGHKHPIVKSSWEEYLGNENSEFCEKNIILEHFKNIDEYKDFAEETLESILEERYGDEDIKKLLIE